MNTPQAEAERRYQPGARGGKTFALESRVAFVKGAEWLAGEIGLTVEQVQRLGPLVEAAREYRATLIHYVSTSQGGDPLIRLWEAAAALDGGTEAERPPESSS